MSIKEQLDQLRSMIPADKQESASVILKGIESEDIDLRASLSSANTESKGRKIKIRELEGALEDKDLKIADYEKKVSAFDDSDLKKQVETYKNKYLGALKIQKDSFVNSFETVEKHPNFKDVLSKKFKIPEKSGEDYAWDKLKDEDWEQNISTYNELNSLRYFDSVQKAKVPDGSKGGFTHDGKRIPTFEEAQELKMKYGTDSRQYREALKLRMENK